MPCEDGVSVTRLAPPPAEQGVLPGEHQREDKRLRESPFPSRASISPSQTRLQIVTLSSKSDILGSCDWAGSRCSETRVVMYSLNKPERAAARLGARACR